MNHFHLLLILFILTGCGVCRKQPPKVETIIRDSTILHIKDSTAIHYIDVEFPVPVEVMREIVPGQDSSHLETSIAQSDAYIDSLGFLHHSLENKSDQSLKGTAPVEEHFREETGIEQHESRQKETVTVEVEKKLNRWQRFRMDVGGYAIFTVILLIGVWAFKKIYLKR